MAIPSYRTSIGGAWDDDGDAGRGAGAGGEPDEPAAGDARPADLEGAGAVRDARIRDLAPHRTDHARDLPGQARLPVPRPLPHGRGGLAHRVVGRVREPPPGEVLP